MTAIKIEPAGNEVRLTVATDEPSGKGVHLDATEVDRLIAQLAAARAGLKPAISGQLGPETSPVHSCDNLLWQVDSDPESRTVTVAFYNAGLGWMSLRLAREQVEDLSTSIEFAVNDLVQTKRQPPEAQRPWRVLPGGMKKRA